MICLLYHDVVDDAHAAESGFPGADADHYKLSPATFLAHLDAGDAAASHVLFTFDDGGISALAPCADLLESRNVRGLFFIVSDMIGASGFCSRSDLRALHARGHRIGSHSASHPVPISSLPDEQLDDQWRRSRAVIEDAIGAPVLDASVPGGFTSPRVEAAAAAAGYTALYTSAPTRAVRRVGPMAVHGRFSITRATSTALVGDVLGGAQLPWIRQAALWEAKRLVKAAGGETWLRFRRRYFARKAGA